MPKWWIPNDLEIIDEVPKTSVGKFSKKTLREQFAERSDYGLNSRAADADGAHGGRAVDDPQRQAVVRPEPVARSAPRRRRPRAR